MGRKEITTKEDLMKVIELFENTGITYWLDGGWGVDILAGKQTRIHRDIDINFDAQHTEKLLNVLLNLGYKIDTDWKPVRIELYSDELGYLDIHPFVLNEDGTSKQADLEGGWYEFEKDYFGSVFFEGKTIPCISLKGQKVFHSGYVPGLIWGLGVIILATITAKKLGYRGEAKLTASIVLKTFWQAIPSLLMIVIVIGGILCGVFTATEGSAVAVVYATVLSLIYGSIKIKDIPRIVLESAKITGTITFMIGLSSIMSWAMAFTGIPDMVAAAVLGITSNKIIIFLLINIILLFVGTFMDPTPAILIFTPIFLPICTSLGMNAVQFGIVLCYNLSVGTITPPVGTILFTGCKVGGVTIESVISHLLPYFVMIIIGLLLVTYVPVLSLGLPSLLGLL